jgi:hypothetical protein
LGEGLPPVHFLIYWSFGQFRPVWLWLTFNLPIVIAAFLPSPSSGGLGTQYGRTIAGGAEESSLQ